MKKAWAIAIAVAVTMTVAMVPMAALAAMGPGARVAEPAVASQVACKVAQDLTVKASHGLLATASDRAGGAVASRVEQQALSASVACPSYVDADGDGVCDHCLGGSGGRGLGYVDADGDGICDNYGSGSGNGYGAGAGACDGSGYGAGGGQGNGAGYGGGHHGGGHGHHRG